MFSVEDHWTGNPFSSLTPKPPGPRNCVQSPPDADETSTIVHRRNKLPVRSCIVISSICVEFAPRSPLDGNSVGPSLPKPGRGKKKRPSRRVERFVPRATSPRATRRHERAVRSLWLLRIVLADHFEV